MKIKAAGILLIILSSFMFFSSCSDFSTLIPSRGRYDIKATVNGNALEDCALIRSGDEINPYFSVSVVNDPDLTGILVYLLDINGEILGEKIVYSLSNQGIPVFSLPETLEMGIYTLVFEALSEEITLSRSEMDFFYISDIKFNLNDIKVYLPSLSSSQLIAPGTTVLLEAELDFDNILDPYLIWYNDKNIIEQGKYIDGLNRILLTVPEQTGFYSLRLEVFPYRFRQSLNGIARSITLAISPKAVDDGYFFTKSPNFEPQNSFSAGTVYPEQFSLISSLIEEYGDMENVELPDLPLPPVLLQWYQFKGNIYDSVKPFNEMSLEPLDTETRWSSAGKGYGLSVGSGDAYALPSVYAKEEDKNEGGGLFLFLIRPIDEGKIFSAFFPSKISENEGVLMEMSRKGYDLVLNLSTMYGKTEMPLYCTSSYLYNPIPVIVEFYICEDRFDAKLSLQDINMQGIIGSIRLLTELSGECKIKLDGGPSDKDYSEKTPEPDVKNIQNTEDHDFSDFAEIESKDAAPEAKIIKYPSYTVWFEFAVLYSTLPLINEDVFIVAEVENEEDNDEEEKDEEILAEEETEIKIEEVVNDDKEDQKPDEINLSDQVINTSLEAIETENSEPKIEEVIELPDIIEDEKIDLPEGPEILTELDIDISAVPP